MGSAVWWIGYSSPFVSIRLPPPYNLLAPLMHRSQAGIVRSNKT
jgi:hypothetical protein